MRFYDITGNYVTTHAVIAALIAKKYLIYKK